MPYIIVGLWKQFWMVRVPDFSSRWIVYGSRKEAMMIGSSGSMLISFLRKLSSVS